MNSQIRNACISLTFIILIAITILPQSTDASNAWDIEITDHNGKKAILSYEQLTTLPTTTVEATLFCYGNLLIGGQWVGVKISDILAPLDLDNTARSIIFAAQDGYIINIPIDVANQEDVILAYMLNSALLSETVRLVIPQANGNMWIAQVKSLTLSLNEATSVVYSNGGPIINMGQTQFLQTPNQTTQAPQQTPTQTTKPSMTPQASPTNHPTTVPTPSNSPSISLQNVQTQVQTAIPTEMLYIFTIAIIAIAALLAITSLRKLRNQKAKSQ